MTADGRPGYEALAALLDYPDRDYPAQVQLARELAGERSQGVAEALATLAAALPANRLELADQELEELQELYTRTFDVQAVTTLGVGYVLFGDDYKRGELLVNLNREMRDTGVDSGGELPDHLPNVLRLIARWPDRELVSELVVEIVRPALARMIAEFGDDRTAERDRLYQKHYKTLIDVATAHRKLFREPLRAALAQLEADFGANPAATPEIDSDFVRALGRELELEADEPKLVQIGERS